ncbi:hypothetical protein ESCO_006702 [Escovopsis weberi]|uniref:MARVEL domain-containing protein n=1 Tax=Escovopsis weberi TaxID=150374 RepID=A0A0M9VVS8_ESCWE|nr:hypothetical protein ESCO_006702 [Escovopsis weberi]
MALIEWDPQIIPGLKLGLHSFQIIATFILWCLEIAVFRADGASIVGLNGWTFAVCFLSTPAWVFLVMTPRFDRTRKFADPYAMFAVDLLMLVLWISAFSTQAAYNSADLCGTICGVSKSIVGLGVIITLLWAGSSLVSAYTMQYASFHNTLPGYDSRKIGSERDIDPDKAAFSMAPHDEEAYERVHMDDHDHDHDRDTDLGHPAASAAGRYDDDHDDDHGRHHLHASAGGPSSRYGSANPYSADDYDDLGPAGSASASAAGGSSIGYAGAAGLGLPPIRKTTSLFESDGALDYASSAGGFGFSKSPSPKPDDTVQFPSGNYDRIQG